MGEKNTQYEGDVVMFLPNKIIKNKKNWIILKKMLTLHMVLKPCATHGFIVHGLGGPCTCPPTTMGCLGGLAHGLKTICKALLNHVE